MLTRQTFFTKKDREISSRLNLLIKADVLIQSALIRSSQLIFEVLRVAIQFGKVRKVAT